MPCSEGDLTPLADGLSWFVCVISQQGQEEEVSTSAVSQR